MKAILTAAALLGASVLALSAESSSAPLQQDYSDPSSEQGLRRVPAPAALDRDAWREMFATEDLAQREPAYAELLHRARARPALMEELEAWAEVEEDSGLAWTLRLALRELGGNAFGPGSAWSRSSPRLGSPRLDLSPFGGALFLDHTERLGQLERRMQQLFGSMTPQAPNWPSLGPGVDVQHRSESFQMQSGPDGVRVEVREGGEDGESVETYEADSVEELFQLHPDLRERIAVGPRVFPGVGDFGAPRAFGLPGARAPLWPGVGATIPTDRLGVYLREGEERGGRASGLPADVGLRVERVLSGSLAEALRVRPGDLLLELDGRELRSAADVAAALADRSAEQTISLERVGNDGARSTLRWQPPISF